MEHKNKGKVVQAQTENKSNTNQEGEKVTTEQTEKLRN